MRILEALITLLCLILILAQYWRPARNRRSFRPALVVMAVVLVLAHLVWEGYRWQMIPLYIIIGLATLSAVISGRDWSRSWTIAGAVAGALLLLLGVAALVLLPVPRMPEPAGPYQIGTVTYHWVDRSRVETYGGADGSLPRELMAQVWYPAEFEEGARPERWLTNGLETSRAMARKVALPIWLVDQITLADSNSYPDAPLIPAGDQLPVVVYLHGWGGFRNVNQDQLETLASLGYVVVSADHTYGSLATVYPDGRIAYVDPSAMAGDGSEAGGEAAAEVLEGVYADDAAFLLDQLEGLNQQDPAGRFTGRLNLEQVGVFGHSTGGGAAVRLCATDARCAAILGMDAWIEPVPDVMIQAGLAQPLMIMNSETWEEGENAERQRLLVDRSTGPMYWMSTAGTWHFDFVMVPSISPLAPALGMKGPLAGKRVVEINNRYLAAFFEKHLRGRAEALLDGPPAEYPEVSFEVLD